MKNLAIFASGTGTNAKRLIEHFSDKGDVAVRLIVSNRRDAPVLSMAEEFGIDTLLLNRQSFYHNRDILRQLADFEIDFIVLAGFLWLVPEYLVRAFRHRMVNIHPALLPKYGGRGMYGMHVHRAVVASGDPETGITIHYVNEHYDEGAIVFQARCPVHPEDTPETVARKVQQLEHKYFPPVVEKLIREEAVELT